MFRYERDRPSLREPEVGYLVRTWSEVLEKGEKEGGLGCGLIWRKIESRDGTDALGGVLQERPRKSLTLRVDITTPLSSITFI